MRQSQPQIVPIAALVQRDVDAALRSGVDDVAIVRIGANHVDVPVQAFPEGLPRTAQIAALKYVRAIVAELMTIECNVHHAGHKEIGRDARYPSAERNCGNM